MATVEQIGGVSCEEFTKLNQSPARLERFWTDQISKLGFDFEAAAC